MEQRNTHLAIDLRLTGEPVSIEPGAARVRFTATPEMAADARGLVHGGFVFGLADHAAMVAVNDPHVVLGAAEVRFTRPVVVGDALVAHARTVEQKGRKHLVEVDVHRGDDVVLSGRFTCFVLDRHVLDGEGSR